jgi:hypothetical protein
VLTVAPLANIYRTEAEPPILLMYLPIHRELRVGANVRRAVLATLYLAVCVLLARRRRSPLAIEHRIGGHCCLAWSPAPCASVGALCGPLLGSRSRLSSPTQGRAGPGEWPRRRRRVLTTRLTSRWSWRPSLQAWRCQQPPDQAPDPTRSLRHDGGFIGAM